MLAAQPVLEAGAFPGVKVGFVKARVATGVKATDDVAVAAAAREHGVKGKPHVCWKAASFAARTTPALRLNGGRFQHGGRGEHGATRRC